MAYAWIACASLILFSSCEEGGSTIDGFAPSSIQGKTFSGDLYEGDLYFDTSSMFSFLEESDHNELTLTPKSYTYRKTGAETADLTIEYLWIWDSGFDSLDETTERQKTYHLHFTSTEAGWYTGEGTDYADFSLY